MVHIISSGLSIVRSCRLVTVWRRDPSCTTLDHRTIHQECLRFYTTDGVLHVVLKSFCHPVQGWALRFFLWTEGEGRNPWLYKITRSAQVRRGFSSRFVRKETTSLAHLVVLSLSFHYPQLCTLACYITQTVSNESILACANVPISWLTRYEVM